MHAQGERVNHIYCTLFYVAKVLSRSHTIFVSIELKLTIQMQFICMELNTYSLVYIELYNIFHNTKVKSLKSMIR